MKTLLDPLVRATADKYHLAYKVIACDPELADTAAFCEHYGYAPEQSANTILVAAKNEPDKLACCVVLATTKLDVNKMVRQLLEAKKASFAPAELTREVTGMEIGGVVAIGIEKLPIYVDAAVLEQDEVIMGGGNRSSKLVLNPRELSKLPNVEIIADLAKPKE